MDRTTREREFDSLDDERGGGALRDIPYPHSSIGFFFASHERKKCQHIPGVENDIYIIFDLNISGVSDVRERERETGYGPHPPPLLRRARVKESEIVCVSLSGDMRDGESAYPLSGL